LPGKGFECGTKEFAPVPVDDNYGDHAVKNVTSGFLHPQVGVDESPYGLLYPLDRK
jgi:hypothetical protein